MKGSACFFSVFFFFHGLFVDVLVFFQGLIGDSLSALRGMVVGTQAKKTCD